jgi:hypothetical protein
MRLVVACVLMVACSHHASPGGTKDDAAGAGSDAALIDAAITRDAVPADGPPPDGMPPPNVTVTCYAQGSPSATCSSPQHCCFSNFSSQHDGSCSAGSCGWGTISCDGPEDCASGNRCCSKAIRDPNLGTIGYTVACQAAPCGAPDLNFQVCHTTAQCPSGTTCVTALGNDNDLPRTLNICK